MRWRRGETGIGTLSTVGGGMAGPQAGRVVAATTGSLEMHGSPRPINSAALGATYAARGSVRSETPGKTVCLRLREWNNDAIVGSAQRCVTTTGSWTSFGALDYTTAPERQRARPARLPDGDARRWATASTWTASRSATAAPRWPPPRSPAATRSCWPPATWPPAGRAATSPCRSCSTRSRARSRSWATRSRTTATPTSSAAASTPAGAATGRARSRPWATTSTAPPVRPGTSTTSARPPASAARAGTATTSAAGTSWC